MPTPFMHLQIAEKIKCNLQDLPVQRRRRVAIIRDEWPAFYLGSVAPDYQTICGVPREVTHFYKLPPEPDNQAYPRMLSRYPQLANIHKSPDGKKVFVAGYIAHLLLDLIWFRQVVMPMFYDRPQLGDLYQRHLLHLILLTHLDKLAYDALPESAGSTLSKAIPIDWLPFATDKQLREWREFLVPQLLPGGAPLTTQIYAGRLHMTAEDFTAKLDDGAWLKQNLFAQVPVFTVQAILADAVPASIRLIYNYLNGELV